LQLTFLQRAQNFQSGLFFFPQAAQQSLPKKVINNLSIVYLKIPSPLAALHFGHLSWFFKSAPHFLQNETSGSKKTV
jgi:hypothetical protein